LRALASGSAPCASRRSTAALRPAAAAAIKGVTPARSQTENGARIGDLFMTLTHTTERARGDPFDYLVVQQRHHEQVAKAPAQGCLGATATHSRRSPLPAAGG